jgi:hypothetical protein
MAGELHGRDMGTAWYCELALRFSSSCKIQFYELDVINMNDSVSVITVEDGLERTSRQAVTR